MFIRYTDPQGRAFNIETTSGGNLARLSQYRAAFPMSDRAVASGLFLRTLTRQEAIASMAETVVDWAIATKRYQDAIEIGDAVLERFPRDGYAMLKRGSAFGALFQAECKSPQVTSSLAKRRCDRLAASNAEDFRKVEALGWKPDA